MLNAALGTSFDSGYGNFSLISSKVRDEFLRVRDTDRHYLMILRWLGFTTASIDFRQEPRYAGKSAYTVGMLLRFAVDGLFSRRRRCSAGSSTWASPSLRSG